MDLVRLVRPGNVILPLERRLRRPRLVGEVEAVAAGEEIAAALGDGVDDAAGEAAIFGGDARGEHLRFLDGVFDEQVVRRPEEVVVDVDAIDQEDVVVRECARNSELACVRRVGRETGGERRDGREVAAGGELADLGVREVLSAGGRHDCRRNRVGLDGDRFGDPGGGKGRIHLDVLPDFDTCCLRERAHAAELESHLIRSGRQAAQNVDTVGIGHRGPFTLQSRRGRRDRHTRQDQISCILDRSRESPRLHSLSGRRTR